MTSRTRAFWPGPALPSARSTSPSSPRASTTVDFRSPHGMRARNPTCSSVGACACSSLFPILGWLFLIAAVGAVAPLVAVFHRPLEKGFLRLWHRQRSHLHQHSVADCCPGSVRASRTQRQLPVTRPGWTLPDQPGRQPLPTGRDGDGYFRFLAVPDAAVETQRSGRTIAVGDALDRITYKTICIAFPLLTFMIATGAYWANRTWGSYWSWDPKETWAAITWLVYAGYLHMRITRGWRGRRAAYFAILGFGVVIFTFLGVTYLLPGLHAYA